MLIWLSVAALSVVAVLLWMLYTRHGASRMDHFLENRKPTSRIVSRAEFVDGSRHMQVALALTSTDLHYENSDMSASLDLRWIRSIEYDSCLATGHAVDGSVLRIRSFSQNFEFVLPSDVTPRWHLMLPPRAGTASLAGTRLAAPVAVAP
jgi:hypothetical protein